MRVPRTLGLLPLGFFAAHAASHASRGTLPELWWACHQADLLLAVSLLVGWTQGARVALLYLAGGLVPYLADAALEGVWWPTSALTHVGGLLVAAAVVGRVGWSTGVWRAGLPWFAAVLAISRWATPPALNVNLAHALRPEARPWFASHGAYWGATIAASLAVTGVLDRVLARRLPIGSPIGEGA